MSEQLTQLKLDFTEGLSQISKFWGFPKGMGAIFAVLYLSPSPLSLDELVEQSGLTKGAVSTNVRALARMGLVRPSTKLGDRKDYYEAETDFYTFDPDLRGRKITETGGRKRDRRQTVQPFEIRTRCADFRDPHLNDDQR